MALKNYYPPAPPPLAYLSQQLTRGSFKAEKNSERIYFEIPTKFICKLIFKAVVPIIPLCLSYFPAIIFDRNIYKTNENV
jgi:hypothetical protein